MPPRTPLLFSTFPVTTQVFHSTPLSYALVNLKPLVAGHVLICPRRSVPRLSSLSAAEIADLFQTVQRVARLVERVYKADGLNIAVQDGEAAGQSVAHVHCHVLPRRFVDGIGDGVYERLEGEEGNIGGALRQKEKLNVKMDADREPRSMEEMQTEAKMLEGKWTAEELAGVEVFAD